MPTQEHGGKVIIEKEKFTKFLDEFENLAEILEVLSDREMIRLIKKSMIDVKKGDVHKIRSASQLKKLLGL